MARTTTSAVQVLNSNLSTIQADAGIEMATVFVDKVANDANCDHDMTTLELIERWLSAHFGTVIKRRADEEEIGEARQKFSAPLKFGLESTMFGQQALALESCGVLNTLNKKKRRVTFAWLGNDDPQRCNVTKFSHNSNT